MEFFPTVNGTLSSCTTSETARVFRPLIYTTIKYSDFSLKCLEILLSSIRNIGRYDNDILIFVDCDPSKIAHNLSKDLRKNILFKQYAGEPKLQKYQIDALPDGYGPFVYVEVDTVFADCLDTLLDQAFRIKSIIVSTEHERFGQLAEVPINKVVDERRIGNWWGLDLVRRDEECWEQSLPLISSGIIAYSDKEAFRSIASLVCALYHHASNQSISQHFGDQPFLNYVLLKTQRADCNLLRGRCDFFASGTGLDGFWLSRFAWMNDADKVERMGVYLSQRKLLLASAQNNNDSAADPRSYHKNLAYFEKKEFLFIVTSAVSPLTGAFGHEDRLQQTLSTLESIRFAAPDAGIIVVDSSPLALQKSACSSIEERCDMFINLGWQNPGLWITRNLNGISGRASDYSKSFAETYALLHGLIMLQASIDQLAARRIFKLSGRYVLSRSFDIKMYNNPEMFRKFAFRSGESPFYQGKESYSTRLWSFCGSLRGGMPQILIRVLNEIVENALDAEHAWREVLKMEEVFLLDKLNIEGKIASNGFFVSE